MTKLRKLMQSTPFINFELHEEDKRYHAIQTDEELAAFYHEMLSKYEDQKFVTLYLYEMIAHSVNTNINNLTPRSI